MSDLAEAHIAAVEYLLNGGASDCFNVGTGVGRSVKEVLASVERVTVRRCRSRWVRVAKVTRRHW